MCVYYTSCVILVSLIKAADVVQAYRILVYVFVWCFVFAVRFVVLPSLLSVKGGWGGGG
jgi:hypothetical protein